MDRDYLQQYTIQYSFPAEAKAALYQAFDEVCGDPDLYQTMVQAISAYESGKIQSRDEMLELLFHVRQQAEGFCVPSETVEVLFFILCSKHLKDLYVEKKMPLGYYDGLASDIISKLRECYTVKGIWGSFVTTWFAAFYVLGRFAIGRLQFDVIDMPACISLDGKYCFNGEQAVNIHIPSGRPLRKPDVQASLKEATAFFADRFPGDSVLFTCHSWLLYPGHYEMLPKESGIRQFMEEFILIDVDIHPDGKDLWRIFDTFDHENLDNLPQNTSLQKSYVQWLKQGKPVGAGLGIRYMAKKEE